MTQIDEPSPVLTKIVCILAAANIAPWLALPFMQMPEEPSPTPQITGTAEGNLRYPHKFRMHSSQSLPNL